MFYAHFVYIYYFYSFNLTYIKYKYAKYAMLECVLKAAPLLSTLGIE
jgi:hypothetical protein